MNGYTIDVGFLFPQVHDLLTSMVMIVINTDASYIVSSALEAGLDKDRFMRDNLVDEWCISYLPSQQDYPGSWDMTTEDKQRAVRESQHATDVGILQHIADMVFIFCDTHLSFIPRGRYTVRITQGSFYLAIPE